MAEKTTIALMQEFLNDPLRGPVLATNWDGTIPALAAYLASDTPLAPRPLEPEEEELKDAYRQAYAQWLRAANMDQLRTAWRVWAERNRE